MRSLITDVIGLSGFGLLIAGIFQQFGQAAALILAGVMMLIYALLMARRRNAT